MKNRPQFLKTEWTDSLTGAKGYLVIDALIKETCGGGIRMRKGLDVGEVERLARAMTYKLVGLGMATGGAKGGIDYDSSAPDSLDVLKRYLEAHKPFLLHWWGTSEDLGTREEDILAILDEIGISTSVYALLAKQKDAAAVVKNLKIALSLIVDGMQVTDVVTGYGVAAATTTALGLFDVNPKEVAVSIQGFGSVGGSAAFYLNKLGFKVAAVADSLGTLYNPKGIDVNYLLSKRNKRGEIDRTSLHDGYQQLSKDDWLGLDVKVLIPAAIADAINETNENQVKADFIIEAANIPTTSAAENKLIERGVIVVPDFIANGGGAALFGSVINKGYISSDQILGHIKEQISTMTAESLKRAQKEKISTRDAAVLIIEEKIKNDSLL